jgi:hypothetical protein
MPSSFLEGLSYILFDKEEIISTNYEVRKLRKPIKKEAILRHYLEQCYKQVNKEQKGNNEK